MLTLITIYKMIFRKKSPAKKRVQRLKKVLSNLENKYNSEPDPEKKHLIGMYGAYTQAKIDYYKRA